MSAVCRSENACINLQGITSLHLPLGNQPPAPKFSALDPHTAAADAATKVKSCKAKVWTAIKQLALGLILLASYAIGLVLLTLSAVGVITGAWWLLLIGSLLVAIAYAPGLYDRVSGSGDPEKQKLAQKLLNNCFESMKAVKLKKTDVELANENAAHYGKPTENESRKAEQLSQQVVKIYKLCQKAPTSGVRTMKEFYKELRAEVNCAVTLQGYHDLAKKQGNTSIQYINQIVAKFIAPEGLKPLREFGLEFVNRYEQDRQAPLPNELNFQQIHAVLKHAVANQKGLNRNSKFGNFIWALANPMLAIQKWGQDHLLNIYEEDNMGTKAWTFTFNNRKTRIIFDGTPTSDRLYTAYLNNLQGKHLDVTLQKTKNTEKKRRIVMQAIAGQHKKKLTQMALDVNQDPWKLKGAYKECRTAGNYLALLKREKGLFSRGNKEKMAKTGIFLPQEVSNADIQRAFAKMKEIVGEDTRVDKKEKRALLIGVYGLLILKAMIGKESVTIRCKQCYDRGPMQNGVVAIYQMALSGAPLTRDRLGELVGALLARPQLGDNREIIRSRADAFLAFLEIFAKNPGSAAAVREFIDPDNAIQNFSVS